MTRPLLAFATTMLLGATVAAADATVIKVGTRPESVTRGFGGKLFVSVMNDPKVPGDGVVQVIDGDRATDFAKGLDEPKGIGFTGKALVVTDVKRVVRIDDKGATEVLANEAAFPQPISYLNDLAVEPGGQAVYVTDMGANTKMRDPQGNLWPIDSPEGQALPAVGRVYRVGLDGKVTLVVDASPDMPCPNGVSAPTKGRLLVAEFFKGNILAVNGKTSKVLASGYRGADGIVQDRGGALIVSSWTQGKVWRLDRNGKKETILLEGLQSAADFYLDHKARTLFVPDMKAGTITVVPLPAR